MNQQSHKLERGPASTRTRMRAEGNTPESEKRAPARPHLDVKAEKRAARVSEKQGKRGQGRMTHPKTNQSNQYR